MAAPSGNGVYVVTQYIPAATSSPVHQSVAPCFLQKFIKGEPKSLGVVQIMIGLINICLGGILCSSSDSGYFGGVIYSGVPFWGAVFYFISGGLSISAEKKGTRCLVTGSLVMNIFSSIAAGISIIVCSVDLTYPYYYYSCYNSYDPDCWRYRDAYYSYKNGIVGVLLLLSLLEFGVSVAVSCFGCKYVCKSCSPPVAQPFFVVHNPGTQDPRVLPMQATGVPLAQGVTIQQGMPLMQQMPMGYGISTVPGAQGVTSAFTTVPPPAYYKDVPRDATQS